MANIPLSDVTLIASALGIFFLIVAFYKSIFHKRRPKSQAAITAQKPAAQENHPVKLADPFQQVPVDSIPLRPSQKQAAPFYPAYPPTFQNLSPSPVHSQQEFEPTAPQNRTPPRKEYPDCPSQETRV
jgi:hypothetical protein